MARVFISFAMEDKSLRDFLVGQKRNARTSIDFTDYSVKEPWSSSWKTNCRQRIKTCRGMIGIITPNTPKADGQLWELKCAIDEGVTLMLIHGYNVPERKLSTLPTVISGRQVNLWTEDNIVNFLNRLG
ncbi:hypothetical protein VWY06_02405 [Phaeobacter sp. JH20_10]|uniref:hypothetical protein n=1 Tax=Phaeobacter sp. JH20_10 TaxID=3112469 RepID=UPI003A8B3783